MKHSEQYEDLEKSTREREILYVEFMWDTA